jgi:hypothetical protein
LGGIAGRSARPAAPVPAVAAPVAPRAHTRPPPARAVVHYHIFKNAGTSVDHALAAAFGSRWATIEGPTPTSRLPETALRRALEAEPGLRAISSHQARPPVPPGVLPILFLRHPVLRAHSVWRFARRDATQPIHAAAQGSFADFLRWADGLGPGSVVIRDYQTIHLSAASWRVADLLEAEAGRDDLREARALLEGLPGFGIVEAFARSARLFERLYRPLLPGFALPVLRENRTNPWDLPDAVQLHRIRVGVGERLYRRLLDMNAHDLALYHAAREIFSRRCAEARV